jgi:hypothetical protein
MIQLILGVVVGSQDQKFEFLSGLLLVSAIDLVSTAILILKPSLG